MWDFIIFFFLLSVQATERDKKERAGTCSFFQTDFPGYLENYILQKAGNENSRELVDKI